MRIMVTGGAGFIGSWICERLLENGHDVMCLDNMSSGREKNVKHLLSNPKFRMVVGDVAKPLKVNKKVDGIFHLASRASPADFRRYSVEILLSNSVGTLNVLEFSRKCGARVLLASSSEVYGDPTVHPQPESYWGNVNPVGFRSCYDEGKRFSEALAMAWHRRYGADVRIARIFNTYGPRMRVTDGRVISNFVVQALRGKNLTVYGRGSQTRSFCYVTDMVEGLMKLMFKEGLAGQVVNLGNPREISILEVAKLIKKLANSNSKIVFKPLPQDDPAVRRPEISKARKLLGWEPRVSLEEGLKNTIEFFREDLGLVE